MKNEVFMKKHAPAVLPSIVYCAMLIFASLFFNCKIEPEEVITKVEGAIDPDETEPDIEINITKEIKEMDLLPVEQYSAYAVCDDKRVFGIEGKELVKVSPVTVENQDLSFADFFKSGDALYFTVKVFEKGDAIPGTAPIQYEVIEVIYYFMQKGDVITKLTADNFPAKPESDFKVMAKTGEFEIIKFTYENVLHSRVLQNDKPIAFTMIDGFYLTDSGLWFSVPTNDPKNIRKKGIYFFEKGKNLNQTVKYVGRIY